MDFNERSGGARPEPAPHFIDISAIEDWLGMTRETLAELENDFRWTVSADRKQAALVSVASSECGTEHILSVTAGAYLGESGGYQQVAPEIVYEVVLTEQENDKMRVMIAQTHPKKQLSKKEEVLSVQAISKMVRAVMRGEFPESQVSMLKIMNGLFPAP